ncbi:MAG: GAF domain-containing sensor histidine kinase [Chloroflexota bacterium]
MATRLSDDIALAPLPFLARAGGVLAETLDLDQTLHRLLDLVVPALADLCSIHMLDEDGRFLRIAAQHRTSHESPLSNRLDGYRLDNGQTDGPIHRLLRRGDSMLSAPVDADAIGMVVGPEWSDLMLDQLRLTSAMVVPLTAHGRPFGVMALATTVRRLFDRADLHLAEELARRAALTIDSARLFRAANESQQAAERARQRTAFLAEASAALASSLDIEDTLKTVVRLAVPSMTDSFSVFLVEEPGVVRRVAAAHVSPDRQRLVDARSPLVYLGDHPRHPIAIALRTGQPYVDNDITDETMQLHASGPYLAFLRQFAMRARLVVPLEARDRRIGALVLATARADRKFDADDVALGVEVAARAALALDNARLYREAANREQALHQLVGRLMTAQEDERRRLAYELHDGVAQMATGVQQLIEAHAFDCPAESDAARRRLDVSIGLARQTVAEIRQVMAGLRPTVLDDFGLEHGLRAQAEDLAGGGLHVEVSAGIGTERFEPAVEIALFRLAQEALTNVRKHAGVQAAALRLTRTAHEVVLEVEDHGHGFDRMSVPAAARPGERLGLLGMHERVTQIGGHVEITSRRGDGTLVRAVVPVPGRSDDDTHADGPG